jgi:hypothetical protein
VYSCGQLFEEPGVDEIGSRWCLVSQRWWLMWKEYTGYDASVTDASVTDALAAMVSMAPLSAARCVAPALCYALVSLQRISLQRISDQQPASRERSQSMGESCAALGLPLPPPAVFIVQHRARRETWPDQ